MMKIFINPGHDIDLDSGAVNPNTGRRECDVARDWLVIYKRQDAKCAPYKMMT